MLQNRLVNPPEEQAETQEKQTCCLFCGCTLVFDSEWDAYCPECKRPAE